VERVRGTSKTQGRHSAQNHRALEKAHVQLHESLHDELGLKGKNKGDSCDFEAYGDAH